MSLQTNKTSPKIIRKQKHTLFTAGSMFRFLWHLPIPAGKPIPARRDIIQVRADIIIKKSKSATGWCWGNTSFIRIREDRDLWWAPILSWKSYSEDFWGLEQTAEIGIEAICFVLYQLQLLSGDYTQYQRVRCNKQDSQPQSHCTPAALPTFSSFTSSLPQSSCFPLPIFLWNIFMGFFATST